MTSRHDTESARSTLSVGNHPSFESSYDGPATANAGRQPETVFHSAQPSEAVVFNAGHRCCELKAETEAYRLAREHEERVRCMSWRVYVRNDGWFFASEERPPNRPCDRYQDWENPEPVSLPETLEDYWCNSMRGRLKVDLTPFVNSTKRKKSIILPRRNSPDGTTEILLRMAGKDIDPEDTVVLRPTVSILCNSSECEDAVRKALKSHQWVSGFTSREPDVKVGFRKGKNIGTSGIESSNTLGKPFYTSKDIAVHLYLQLPRPGVPICGLELRALIFRDDTILCQSKSVVGGPLAIGEDIYVLSTAHTVLDFQEDDIEDDSDPASIPSNKDWINVTEVEWMSYEGFDWDHKKREFRVNEADKADETDVSFMDRDIILIKLSDLDFQYLSKSYSIDGFSGLQSSQITQKPWSSGSPVDRSSIAQLTLYSIVRGIADRIDGISGEVSIISRQGDTIKGYLLKKHPFMQRGKEQLKRRKLLLDECLGVYISCYDPNLSNKIQVLAALVPGLLKKKVQCFLELL